VIIGAALNKELLQQVVRLGSTAKIYTPVQVGEHYTRMLPRPWVYQTGNLPNKTFPVSLPDQFTLDEVFGAPISHEAVAKLATLANVTDFVDERVFDVLRRLAASGWWRRTREYMTNLIALYRGNYSSTQTVHDYGRADIVLLSGGWAFPAGTKPQLISWHFPPCRQDRFAAPLYRHGGRTAVPANKLCLGFYRSGSGWLRRTVDSKRHMSYFLSRRHRLGQQPRRGVQHHHPARPHQQQLCGLGP
jgi:hypothetical protein